MAPLAKALAFFGLAGIASVTAGVIPRAVIPRATTSTATTSTATTSTSSDVSLPTGLESINLKAKHKGRYFGTAVNEVVGNNDTKYLELSFDFAEFGLLTPENALKWESTEPTQGVFNFTWGDQIVDYAHANGLVVRGHNFVWYSQLPTWLTAPATNWTNATLISVMENHIEKLGGHYKGRVYCWDVINEPFNDDGTWRSTPFYDTIGPAYIPIALKKAAEVDPHAKAYINDYNVEGVNNKSDAHYALFQELLAAGYKLDGFGIQGHLIVGSVPTDIPTNIARFTALGIEVAFTELDIRMPTPANATSTAQQEKDYTTVVDACIGDAGCVGLQTWETSDDYSWVPTTFPGQGSALLFDENKNPKPAYFSVATALKGATTRGHFHGWGDWTF